VIIRILVFMVCFRLFAFGSCLADDEEVILRRLDFIDANAMDVVRMIAERGDYSLVMGSIPANGSLKKITLHMKDVGCLEAIDHVLKMSGYRYEIRDKTILISNLPHDIVSSAYRNKEEVLDLKHTFAEEAGSFVSKIFPDVLHCPGPASNTLIIRGDSENVERARLLVKQLDRPGAQILIEGSVIEVSESGMEELGLKWGSETGRFKFAIDRETGEFGLTEDIMVVLNRLASEGKAEILAEPKVLSHDGCESSINIGSRIPYAVPAGVNSDTVQWTVQYIDAGVSLKIVPKVSADGYIDVFFRPEVSSISEWRTTSAGEFPVITTRNAESRVRVKEGETIIIGGLINKSQRENLSKIFLLGDIPLLGFLFQNRVKEESKTEVVFTITPKII